MIIFAVASALLNPCEVKIAILCSADNALEDRTAFNWLLDRLLVISASCAISVVPMFPAFTSCNAEWNSFNIDVNVMKDF